MCEKLDQLVTICGYQTPDELIEHHNTFLYNTVPGICTQPGCDYTTDIEPDQEEGFCEYCQTNSVKSVLVLAELI